MNRRFSRFNRLWKLIMEQTETEEQPVDFKYKDMTIAIVPGSFKPPHKGHWEMVMSYVQKVDKVLVLISNISKAAISSRPMSLSNLRELGKLKEQIEWMKNNWEKSPRIDEDLDIINGLTDKADTLTYSELKKGLEKIQKSDMLRSPTYRKIQDCY